MNLAIANTSIRQDAEGRYSLNDLHRAAGGERRHQPRYWLANQQTKELVHELNSGDSRNIDSGNPLSVQRGGRAQGTYVCKELVYAYAMWISPAFCVKVIRAYDAGQSGRQFLSPWEEIQALNLRDTETSIRASVGAVWMNDRKRELPVLRRERARLEVEIQPSLFALQRVMQGEARR